MCCLAYKKRSLLFELKILLLDKRKEQNTD